VICDKHKKKLEKAAFIIYRLEGFYFDLADEFERKFKEKFPSKTVAILHVTGMMREFQHEKCDFLSHFIQELIVFQLNKKPEELNDLMTDLLLMPIIDLKTLLKAVRRRLADVRE